MKGVRVMQAIGMWGELHCKPGNTRNTLLASVRECHGGHTLSASMPVAA